MFNIYFLNLIPNYKSITKQILKMLTSVVFRFTGECHKITAFYTVQ